MVILNTISGRQWTFNYNDWIDQYQSVDIAQSVAEDAFVVDYTVRRLEASIPNKQQTYILVSRRMRQAEPLNLSI